MERVEAFIKEVLASEDVTIQEGGEFFLAGPIAETQPQQYLYELFKPLTEEEIVRLAEDYRQSFPQSLAEFYRLTNGAFLFGRHIAIFGMPLWSAQYKQPMALTFADAKRPRKTGKTWLFFAAYNADSGVRLFFDTSEPESMPVCAADAKGNVVARWPSFADWLMSENEKYQAKYQRGEYTMTDIAGVLKEIDFDVEL